MKSKEKEYEKEDFENKIFKKGAYSFKKNIFNQNIDVNSFKKKYYQSKYRCEFIQKKYSQSKDRSRLALA
eukprot:snap_masked-scaffold_68-processed-gene-0.76-mRNA-1 protein AED:1.00 eAED:1.00 QI:0/-1/0/0/-1/1/1/0/69